MPYIAFVRRKDRSHIFYANVCLHFLFLCRRNAIYGARQFWHLDSLYQCHDGVQSKRALIVSTA